MDMREFLRVNNLKQVSIARYLGVTEAAISNVVKGKSDFSNENLIKLLNNPHGWDTSMLTQQETPVDQTPSADNSLIDYLQRKIEELEREKAELLQENAVLKYENRMLAPSKGESAGDVVPSLSANAG